ncbi:Allergen V5/Tpx-1 family protein [Thermosinus carboxydivorans Nor1]|uniref:Allergen V5/Tpx-1 family protein n=1 Tax=Thermosinus carboxydivorans Nor1 TaxID=401526 RepID=A1HPV1_9FIRM|nr:CAP domain-containing protein [Thermosinus carboxydivorans]EAX48069.1 Allergen V5/Tpx-1 family protein [Thermosinus carboxydivorans Nor1]
MRSSKLAKIAVLSVTIGSMLVTSLGGAYATAALAATPEVQATEKVDKADKADKVLMGVAALGLLAMLTKGGKDGSKETPAKTSAPPSNGVHTPSANQTQPTQTKPTQSQPTSSASVAAEEQQAVALLNADRAKYGLPALKVNPQLTDLARRYAQDMINRGYFSHYNPEGQSPFDRMRAAGISYRYAGENLAINQNVASAELAFMNSPGHRANILSSNYTEVGIGVRHDANGSVYVVQEFIGK